MDQNYCECEYSAGKKLCGAVKDNVSNELTLLPCYCAKNPKECNLRLQTLQKRSLASKAQ